MFTAFRSYALYSIATFFIASCALPASASGINDHKKSHKHPPHRSAAKNAIPNGPAYAERAEVLHRYPCKPGDR